MAMIEQYMRIIEDTASLLQKAQINLKKCPKQRLTQGYIETRLKCIEEYWNTFKEANQNLCKSTPRDKRADIPYFVNEDYYIIEDLYLCLEADLKDMLRGFRTRSNERQSTSNSTIGVEEQAPYVKLPRIQLPVYHGKYEDWPTYHDLFTSLVHNNTSISNVQKLYYLKTSVAGEAASLLKHIQVTDSNYSQAWNTLKNRYGNKRIILTSILKRLFSQKKISTQSAYQIKALLDTTTECINNLNNLSILTDSWDPVIIFLVVQKLDSESHKEWEEYTYKENKEDLPSWAELRKFLESKFRTLELVNPYSLSAIKERPITTKERTFHAATTEKTCFMCKENHTLCHCKEFAKMDPQQRSHYVKTNKLCFNCLLPGHAVYKCRIAMTCRICHRRHHSLLHEDKNNNAGMTGQQEDSLQPNVSAHFGVEEQNHIEDIVIASNYTSNSGKETAFLATAMVTVKNKKGHTVVLRALIDLGSEQSFISEKAAQLLKLERAPVKATVVGMGSMKSQLKQMVQVHVSSKWDKDSGHYISAYVMSKQLTTKIPQKVITGHGWHHIQGLILADPTYYKPGPVDLLLGVKVYSKIIENQLIKGPPGTPSAQKTSLGWILFGEIDTTSSDESIVVLHAQVDVEEMLKTIWEIDADTKRHYTKEEKLCEDLYKNTVKRNKEGRYVVKLPFNKENIESPNGNTRNIAVNRLLQLERRFKRNPKLKDEYTMVIDDYLRMGHMEEVPKDELNTKKCVYLPHHAVVREDKETTRTRVVFDASCKGDNDISLNDELLTGPILQDDLRSIIMRWRLHFVCYAADIQKMYRMILLTNEDVDYQRILWRENDKAEIKDYRLLTVTFGTASAPYLAVRTLRQLAVDEERDCPIASRITLNDFYVDDLLSGCDTVDQAIFSYQQMKEMMRRGGFELKKWSSNNIDFMKAIAQTERSSKTLVDLNVEGTIKALGILWNLGRDEFEYNLSLTTIPTNITKRHILSDVQKLFDPLGWIAPIIILAKILIQEMWIEKLHWDEDVKSSLAERWKNIRSDLENVKLVKIRRWLHTTSTNREAIQLHGFSDASMRAYAAVVYVRVENTDGSVTTSLVAAKTKVAPVKTISLPRLELCGALLLSRLLKDVAHAINIPSDHIYAWTDSEIVLAWLFGDPNRWKIFIANRVVEITENVHQHQWYHVQSHDNPADIASRGMLLLQLHKNKLWWQGPDWLSQNKIEYSRPKTIETELESKRIHIQTNLNIQEDQSITSTFENFDNLNVLTKAVAYCIRFLNFKKNIINQKEPLTTTELENALQRCIKLTQIEEFTEEIKTLKNKKEVKKKSSVKSLNPYLDDHDILRVGGRLRHAEMNHNSKHPIILGHRNNLTPLIIADAHKQTLHGGVQLMMSYLRTKYWIIRAKSLIKKHIHKCLICARHNAIAKRQLMGDLPKVRVTPARPFLNSGVDFAGPIQILLSKGRGAKTSKAYIAIFICMVTKAIHLELVGDLTSDAFIAAFRRFISRRGKCTHLWSDQGRNFIGANKELQALWNETQLDFKDQLINSLVKEGTQWHFIPPYSPNFGGLWETGVRSVKYHLKKILTRNLTFEEMTTTLCQIEACLNSRPLSPIDDTDVDNLDPLTPGHFLIGESPIIIPSAGLQNAKLCNLSRWQHVQKVMTDFWQRWQHEYLSRLQQRPKWLKREREFEKGNIVLIKTNNLPPGKWLLGRVIDKHPGPDGITRVYSVKSGDSVTKRCVTKLCALPIETDNNVN